MRLQHLESLLSERTRVVSVVHVSNMLGFITNMQEVGRLAHQVRLSVGYPLALLQCVKAGMACMLARVDHFIRGPVLAAPAGPA